MAIPEVKVYLGEDNIIRYELKGIIDDKYIEELGRKREPFLRELESKGLPIRMLADSRGVTKSTARGREASVKQLNETKYDKIAVYGLNSFLTVLSRIISKALGKSQKIEYFRTEKEALEWLNKQYYS